MIFDLAAMGAVIACLIILLRGWPPLLVAKRTGVLTVKSYAGQKILRTEDPDRFDRLWRQRSGALTWPAIVLVLGILYLLAEGWAWIQVAQRSGWVAPPEATQPLTPGAPAPTSTPQ